MSLQEKLDNFVLMMTKALKFGGTVVWLSRYKLVHGKHDFERKQKLKEFCFNVAPMSSGNNDNISTIYAYCSKRRVSCKYLMCWCTVMSKNTLEYIFLGLASFYPSFCAFVCKAAIICSQFDKKSLIYANENNTTRNLKWKERKKNNIW